MGLDRAFPRGSTETRREGADELKRKRYEVHCFAVLSRALTTRRSGIGTDGTLSYQ
jgi:hypothetical protein